MQPPWPSPSGARQRRSPRQRPPISPAAPLEGRQLWRIGDWGGASEQIGRRWESLGAAELRSLFGQPRPCQPGATYVPTTAVIISAEPELALAVHRSGRAHADAILLGRAGHAAVLEPVDFKWTLETAEHRQVGREVLEALLSDPPPLLAERLGQALARIGVDETAPRQFQTGFFLAPDYPPNRRLLAPAGPFHADTVVLRPVEAAAFFSPLVGWPLGQVLAQAEGRSLTRLEVAERYYRLGAGVLGALRRLASGIFAEELVELDGVAALQDLRQQRRLRTTGEIIAYLDRALRARAERAERLAQIERSIYPFAALREEVTRQGISAPSERWLGRLHGEVMREVRQAVRREGRALVAAGKSELEAIDALAAMQPRFAHLAQRTLARRLAESR